MGTLKDGNVQITAVLPKTIVDSIDEDAKEGYRTRSQQIAKIILEHYQSKEDTPQ